MLEDGIHTLAYGHKDVEQTLEADHDPPTVFDQVLPSKESKRVGLLWERRRRCVIEVGYDPAIQVEESEEDSTAARHTMRARVAGLVNQIPDHEYQFLPNEDQTRKANSSKARQRTRPGKKYRRVQLGAGSDVEDEFTQESSLPSSDEEETADRTTLSPNKCGSSRKRRDREQAAAFFDEEAEEDGSASDSDLEIDNPSDASNIDPADSFL